MYSRKRTLTDTLTTSNKEIDLPRGAVLDAIMLRATITLANGGGSAVTPTYGQALNTITEIRLMGNGSDVHYALSGNDAAIMNWYDKHGQTVNPDASSGVEIAASGTGDVEVLLTLDAGDILALLKDSLTLSIETQTATGVADLTLSALSVEVTVDEDVYASLDELKGVYGQSLELAAEPKVVVKSESFSTLSELSEILELPVGTLLRRGFVQILDSSGDRSNSVATKIGIKAASPEERDLYAISFGTAQLLDKQEYDVSDYVDGVAVIDYTQEITNDGLGLKGWRYNKGDMVLTAKTSAAGSVRYISHEHIVNTALVDSMGVPVFEAD